RGGNSAPIQTQPRPSLSAHPRTRWKQRSNTNAAAPISLSPPTDEVETALQYKRSRAHLSQPTHGRGGNSAPIQTQPRPSLSGPPRTRWKQRSNTNAAAPISLSPPTDEVETALQYKRSRAHLSQAPHGRGGNSAPIQTQPRPSLSAHPRTRWKQR